MIDVVMKRDAQGRERPQEKDFNEDKRVVRVVPKNDDLRKYLKHPKAGRFLAEGSSEWPNDQFTRRRLKEGDITIEESAAPKAGEPKAIEASGAKSAKGAKQDKEAPPADTSTTTAPKTA